MNGSFRFGRPFEGPQIDLEPRGVLRAKFRRRQIQFRRIENRPTPIVAQLLVPVDDAAPRRIGCRTSLVDIDQDTARRQVFEEMRSAVEEQGQEELDAPRRLAGAHVAINRLLRQIARETQPVAAAKLAYRVRIQRRLARGQQLDTIQLVQRALRVRIEAPDAVDVAIQHVDSIRSVRAHGKNVDQRTAHREFAVCDDLGDGGISGQRQPRAQCFQIECLADMDFERIGLDVAAGRQSLQQRVDGDQPDAPSGARQFGKRREPGRGDIGMRGEAVVG